MKESEESSISIDMVQNEMNLKMWSDTYRPIYQENDFNNDNTLSKRDLGSISKEHITKWAKDTTSMLFNFWGPDIETKKSEIRLHFTKMSNEHEDLAHTKSIPQKYEKLVQALGFNSSTLSGIYVKTELDHDEVTILDEGFTDTARKWYSVRLPATITLYKGDNHVATKYWIHLLGYRKFKRDDYDLFLALVDINISERQ